MSAPPELLTTGQAAKVVAVSRETIRRWVADGTLTAVALPSGQFRFRRGDVEALLTPAGPASVVSDEAS